MKFLKKKKLTVMIAAGLAGVSLSSVGFAGWVINATTEGKGNVTIDFGSVTNNAYSGELTTLTDDKLKFDCVRKNNTTNDIQGSADNQEDLHIAFTFKIFKTGTSKEPGATTYTNVDKAKIEFTSPADSPLAQLITDGYICAPVALDTPINIPLAEANPSEPTTNSTDKTTTKYKVTHDITDGISVTCEYNFAWGTKFDRVNPQDVNKESLTDVKANLAAFNEIAKGKTGNLLNIKITPVLKTIK